MPTRPPIRNLTTTAPAILNAIRNSATQNYRDAVPIASATADSVRAIGAVIMQDVDLQNNFINALVNRIGFVMITSRLYDNPWAIFKRGVMDFGEKIEEVFVELAKPFQFDPVIAETELFKRLIPDVRTLYHVMNYQKFYKVTISEPELRAAFLTWNGITDLISRIIESLYTSANYDEFLVMKYLVGRNILNGTLTPVTIPAATAANASDIVKQFRATSTDLTFMSTKYTATGVHNYSDRSRQVLIVTGDFEATMDVDVLASAFNMDKAQFMGQRVLIDSFASTDPVRLAEIFADTPEQFTPFTAAEIAQLESIPAILVDRDWFQIYDNFIGFRDAENGQGLYWNYLYHTWKTFDVSHFSSAVVFVPGTPSVTSVTVTPPTATAMPGQQVLLSASVATTNFAPAGVNWSVSDDTKASVDSGGTVTLFPTATGTVTATATSVFDSTKSGSSTITIGTGTT